MQLNIENECENIRTMTKNYFAQWHFCNSSVKERNKKLIRLRDLVSNEIHCIEAPIQKHMEKWIKSFPWLSMTGSHTPTGIHISPFTLTRCG